MAQRFNQWDLAQSPDFWKSKFTPTELLNVMAHAASVLSQRKDARLLERYDINKLEEHTPGTCYIWVPLTLGDPIYLGDDELFPWQYEVDKNWLYIDCIYDKHVDPEINLQNGIDFQFEQGSGKIFTSKKVENSSGYCPQLYISKGWYAEYRIYNEIGHFLNYVDKDSPEYRDSIDPILATLFEGPTYKNMLAVLNVMVGLPVAKYDNEKVISVTPWIVVTDKYQYNIEGVHTRLKAGDVLFKFQPLTDAVVLHVHQQEPKWWVGHPCEMFSKYTPGTLLNEYERDFLMENYWSESVTKTEFRQDRLGNKNIDINRPVYKNLLNAAPIRTDFLFAQTYHVGITIDPKGDILDPRYSYFFHPVLHVMCCYGRFGGRDVGLFGQFGKDATLIGHGKIYTHLPNKDDPDYSDEKYQAWMAGDDYFGEQRSKRKRFTLRDGLWHIRKKSKDGMYEFWRYETPQYEYPRYEWRQAVMVEPWYEVVHIRMESERGHPLWPGTSQYRVPYDLISSGGTKETNDLRNFVPETITRKLAYIDPEGKKHYKSMTGFSGPGTTGNFSSMSNVSALNKTEIGSLGIPASTIYEYEHLRNWEKYNVAVVDNRFVVGNVAEDAYLIGPVQGLDVGVIPKILTPTATVLVPVEDPKVYFQVAYSRWEYNPELERWEWSAWTIVSHNGKDIKDPFSGEVIWFTGKVRFKIILNRNLRLIDGNPSLSRFRVQVRNTK